MENPKIIAANILELRDAGFNEVDIKNVIENDRITILKNDEHKLVKLLQLYYTVTVSPFALNDYIVAKSVTMLLDVMKAEFEEGEESCEEN